MPLRVLLATLLILAPLAPLRAQTADPAQATQPSAEVASVVSALRMPDIIAVMREEGLAYGDDLEEELFPGAGGARWTGAVQEIYDEAAMLRRFEAAFATRLSDQPQAMQAIVEFFASDRGQRILTLEIEARRALLDEAVEDAARVRVDDMRADNDPRLDVLQRFAEVNDLVEQNVSGALNANLAFYAGMVEAGAFAVADLTEDEILAQVWSQEADIRAETETWLYPFLTLAYGPLPDEDMQAYVAFSETPAAQAMNAALFVAFDAVFSEISRDLGRAAAQMLSGQDI
jgi:hypothetical protein